MKLFLNYLKEEKIKINQLPSLKKKAEYIAQYYYLWIIGIAAAIFLIWFSIYRYTTALKDYWFYITFTNTYAEIGTGSELYKGYLDFTGYDISEKNVAFNNVSYFDYKKSVTGNTYFQEFVAYADGGTLDAITMQSESLEALGESGRLLDLDDERCSSIKEKYGDRFIYSKPYDEEYGKDLVPVGIDISDSILMTKYHINVDSCALGIGACSKNIEAVEKFLDYIYE